MLESAYSEDRCLSSR